MKAGAAAQGRAAGGFRLSRRFIMAAGLGGVMMAALALVAGGALVARDGFPFRTLRIEGVFEHVSAGQVAGVVAPYAAAGFFATDVAAIKQALEALPWVSAAAVRRIWPDVLHVTLVEQTALARWGEEGLVNPQGEVFFPSPGEAGEAGQGDLPVLAGPSLRAAPQVVERYRGLSRVLRPLGLGIRRLSMDARHSWQLTLSDGSRLILGRGETEARLRRFVRFYPGLAREGNAAAIVDLRYTNGFAVLWAPVGEAVRMSVGEIGDRV